MTSNVGLSEFTRSAALGFGQGEDKGAADEAEYQRLRDKIMEGLHDYFRPEFLNRLNHIVVFKPLTITHATAIAEIQIRELAERLSAQHIGLTASPAVAQLIAKEGFNADEGARGIRRAVEQHLEHPLAERLLAEEFKAGDTVLVQIKNKKIAFTKAPHATVARLPLPVATP
jgi:ATP-dependent Clp protease ATP-binding subunit ClpC